MGSGLVVEYINDIIRKHKKIIAWGAGDYYRKYSRLVDHEICFIIDNDTFKQGNEINGVKVVSAELLANEDQDHCMVIIFSDYFDEIRQQILQFGLFDIMDYSLLRLLKEQGKIIEKYKAKTVDNVIKELPIVICAGMYALWDINGSRKFIDGQISQFMDHGLYTLEIAPLKYYEKGRSCEYIGVSSVHRWIGIFTISEFLEKYPIVLGFIIHSLYHDHHILEEILSRIIVKNKILYYVHDYYCICTHRFLYNEKRKCQSTDALFQCTDCSYREMQMRHMQFHFRLFQKYGITLAAPSDDTKTRLEKVFTKNEIKVIPHLLYEVKNYQKSKKKRIRIAFAGGVSWLKGWEDFAHIVAMLKDKYEFYCLGVCSEKLKIDNVVYVNIGLEHTNDTLTMVEALLANQIDIVYLGSICPETYSYTYYEAYEAGCFVITNELSGNICAQVLKNQNGLVYKNIGKLIHWLEDENSVVESVADMNKKIVNVKSNDSFLDYFINSKR